MTHFAVFAPPLKGHYHPYSNLACELIARGHRVTFVHHEDARLLVEAPEAEFAAVGAKFRPVESWTRPMGKISGILGLGGTIKRMGEFTTMLCREAPALLRRAQIDAVISDQLEPAGALIAEHLGLPWISVATTLPMDSEDGVPPPFVNWMYDPSPKGVRRNRWGWRVSNLILRPFNTSIERNAKALGLGPRRSMEDCFSTSLQIAQLVEGIDFPRSKLRPSLRYAGRFSPVSSTSFELPESDGRPTAYCTLGTLQGGRTGLFRRIARACELASVRLVLTHGRRGDPSELGDLPGDPLIYDWLPQHDVLRQVDLVVCHAGMITVLDALSCGLPIIAMPLAFEQPGIAARLRHSGAGIMLSRRASARSIALAIARSLDEPSFRTRAQELANEIARAGGVSRASDLVEQWLARSAMVPVCKNTMVVDQRGEQHPLF